MIRNAVSQSNEVGLVLPGISKQFSLSAVVVVTVAGVGVRGVVRVDDVVVVTVGSVELVRAFVAAVRDVGNVMVSLVVNDEVAPAVDVSVADVLVADESVLGRTVDDSGCEVARSQVGSTGV